MQALKRQKGRIMLSSNSAVCSSKKNQGLKIKEQEASELLSSLGITMSLSQVSILIPMLFLGCKMNQIRSNFLLATDKFMPEIHLKQPGFMF